MRKVGAEWVLDERINQFTIHQQFSFFGGDDGADDQDDDHDVMMVKLIIIVVKMRIVMMKIPGILLLPHLWGPTNQATKQTNKQSPSWRQPFH